MNAGTANHATQEGDLTRGKIPDHGQEEDLQSYPSARPGGKGRHTIHRLVDEATATMVGTVRPWLGRSAHGWDGPTMVVVFRISDVLIIAPMVVSVSSRS